MGAIAYSVIATLPDQAAAGEYIAWLEDGHVDKVVTHGAHNAMIIRLLEPPAPIQVETRYIFPNRAAYENYLSEAAPALRAEGMKRFPSIRFERRLGEVL